MLPPVYFFDKPYFQMLSSNNSQGMGGGNQPPLSPGAQGNFPQAFPHSEPTPTKVTKVFRNFNSFKH